MVPHTLTASPTFSVHANSVYDITYDVPKRINPDMPDVTSRATIHTINVTRHLLHEDGRLLFVLPYHEGVFWTNVKYACHGAEHPFSVGMVGITEHGTWVDILPSESRPAATWIDTNWPIPSLPHNRNQVFVSIKPQDPSTNLQYLRIKILGFTHLFPPSDSYALMDGDHSVIRFVSGTQEENMSPSSEYRIRRIQEYG